MRNFTKNKKLLFGLAVSLVLAMAVGSFALGEAQTLTTPQIALMNDYDTGAFDVEGGTAGTDYDYANGVLSIHPQSSDTSFEIKNKDPGTETQDRIEITAGPNDTEKAVNITLNGVNINTYDGQALTDMGAALKIAENAEFNVNITLADNSKNYLTSDSAHAGLEKSDDKTTEADIAKLGTLTIGVPSDSTAKNGMLEANGGHAGAGIGGNNRHNGRNITITGGVVNAKGMGGPNKPISGSAGIGGGGAGNGSDITISGGTVIATGGYCAAGIGGGTNVESQIGYGSGSDIMISGGLVYAYGGAGAAGIGGAVIAEGNEIKITGGVVTATGGLYELSYQGIVYKITGAGIGGGGTTNPGSGEASKNSISGNAIVLAASGGENTVTGETKEALQGFDDASQGSISNGITFTGIGTEFDKDTGIATKIDWKKGEQYGNSLTITEDVTFPTNFTITSNAALTIGKNAAGKEATLSMAEGKKLTVEGSLTNNGVIDIPAENLICTGNGKITTLLNYDPQGGSIKTNDDNYITYKDASGVKKYENLPEAIKEGYDLEGWHTEKTGKEDTKVESTDNVLLNQHMLYANWVEPTPTPTPPTPTPPTPTPPGPEPGPEPTPTPEPTPDPSVNPDGGGSGASSKTSDPFMGGMALALLGVATTGAVLVRKRK